MSTTRKARIERVWVERKIDEDPDMSYLGEYSSTPADGAIDREERGDMQRGEYRYWIPGPNHNPVNLKSWEHVSDEQVARALANLPPAMEPALNREEAIQRLSAYYVEQDYQRCEEYNRGEWCMVGIIAKATVISEQGIKQTLRSMGLWGIESDSDDTHFQEVAREELDQLAEELMAFGFGERAVSYAIKRAEKFED